MPAWHGGDSHGKGDGPESEKLNQEYPKSERAVESTSEGLDS